MLLGSYQLLFNEPAVFLRLIVLVVFAGLVAVTVRGLCQALVAGILGDEGEGQPGRFTLNPWRHLEPVGMVMLVVSGFGWGKSLPVNRRKLDRGPWGVVLVSATGPLANLVVAFLLALPVKAGLLGWSNPTLGRATYVLTGGMREGLSDIVGILILINLLLAVFNLIPLAPLDGSKVVGGLVPQSWVSTYARLERLGPLILVGIIALDYISGLGILWSILGPAIRGLVSLATGY
jgi:Zn-dependent protease